MNFENHNAIAINVKKLCSEALKEIDSNNDIEDALSKVSKKLYADNSEGALMVINLTLIRLKHTEGGTKLENVKKLAQGEGMSSIRFGSKKIINKKHMAISNSDDVFEETLNEIPEEFREEFAKLRREMQNSGKGNQIIKFRKNPILNFEMSKKESGKIVSEPVQRKVMLCSKCNYKNPYESDKCINCSSELKKSFFSKLFGK